MSKLVRFISVGMLTVACAAASGLQQGPSSNLSPADAARQQDVYAIYSKFISGADELYLIEATTLTSSVGFGTLFRPQEDRGPSRGCVVAAPGDIASLNEAFDDYSLRKDIPATLRREFVLDKAYELLSTNETQQFLQDALNASPQVRLGGPPPVNLNPLFQKAKRVFRLGDVYFDRSRSLALTYISILTTTMDGTGGWRLLKKAGNGQWQASNGGCGWGAGR